MRKLWALPSKPAASSHHLAEDLLGKMPERRMAEVVAERGSLGSVDVELFNELDVRFLLLQELGEATGDLGHLVGVGQAVVECRSGRGAGDLGDTGQATERRAVEDSVAVALGLGAGGRLGLLDATRTAIVGRALVVAVAHGLRRGAVQHERRVGGEAQATPGDQPLDGQGAGGLRDADALAGEQLEHARGRRRLVSVVDQLEHGGLGIAYLFTQSGLLRVVVGGHSGARLLPAFVQLRPILGAS